MPQNGKTLKRQKKKTCLVFEKTNIVNTFTLSKARSRINAVPIKIPKILSEIKILKIEWNHERST